MNFSFNNSQLIILYLLLILIYVLGLFLPVMDLDSAQDATMAMRMFTENDFWNIIKSHKPYLDKPHMHFWLSAISYAVFGVSEFAYRFPAFCMLMLGAWSVFQLGKLLYNKQTGLFSALIFLSSQSIILSAHDVRTDAVLTGATAFALYHAVKFLKQQNIVSALLAGFFAGIAFDTKGLIALVFIGLALFCYLLYERGWRKLLNFKFVLALFALVLAILPVLYAYYQQYDLHPELEVAGQTNVSGVRFILYDQVFNRLNATGFDETSPDYFFFFHTLLWVFLPFSLLGYKAIFSKIKTFFDIQFKKQKGVEFLTLGGTVFALFLFSFSKFKLPHYLNILIPTLSVLTASYITELAQKKKVKTIRVWAIIQTAIVVLIIPLTLLLLFFVFEKPSILHSLVIILSVLVLLFLAFVAKNNTHKIVFISVLGAIWLNFNLNTVFYPNLLEYQGGMQLARIVNEKDIPKNNIYFIKDQYFWSFDFYTRQNTPFITWEELKHIKQPVWLVMESGDLNELHNKNFTIKEQFDVDTFHVTRISLKFLRKSTRANVLGKTYLVEVLPEKGNN